MTNEPNCSTHGATHHDIDQVVLPAGFRGGEPNSGFVAGKAEVSDLVELQRVLEAPSKQPLVAIGVTAQLRSLVPALLETLPDLQERYNQVKSAQSSWDGFLGVTTFGLKQSPIQRLENELRKAVGNVVEQLKQQGLVAVSVEGSMPYMPVGARAACGDGPPVIVTTIWTPTQADAPWKSLQKRNTRVGLEPRVCVGTTGATQTVGGKETGHRWPVSVHFSRRAQRAS